MAPYIPLIISVLYLFLSIVFGKIFGERVTNCYLKYGDEYEFCQVICAAFWPIYLIWIMADYTVILGKYFIKKIKEWWVWPNE